MTSVLRLDPPRKFVAGHAVLAFGVVVMALLWGCLTWHIGQERARVQSDAQTDVGNLVQVLDAHLQRTIAGLDQTLLVLKADYQRDPANFKLATAIDQAAAARGVALQISLVDGDGWLRESTIPGFVPVDLSDREHIQVHAVPNSQMFISKPVFGRASGKWSIQLTRRLDRPDGGLAGVLVLSLDPHYLIDIYRSIDVGAHGAVALIGQDGIIRAAISAGEPQIGGRIANQGLVERMFSSRIGFDRLSGFLGEGVKLAGFRTLPERPLAVVVARSLDDIMARHAQTQFDDVLAGIIITVVFLAAMFVLYRMVSRQEHTARVLAAKKAELIASRGRLKRYVADLERIAEVAAHDLQEPLRRVVAYTQLLAKHAESALDAEGRDYVAQVVTSAQRMRKLVADLESYVAVDRLPDVDVLTSAQDAVAAAAERLAEPMKACSVILTVDRLPEIAADERSLTEVFMQLLDNAIRYRRSDRQPQIHISARDDGRTATFSVRDNGIGIKEADCVRLFEIFHRLRGIDGQDGTGIGLATARRIIERLGGNIWVESVPDEGSVFLFTLPMILASSSQETEARAAE